MEMYPVDGYDPRPKMNVQQFLPSIRSGSGSQTIPASVENRQDNNAIRGCEASTGDCVREHFHSGANIDRSSYSPLEWPTSSKAKEEFYANTSLQSYGHWQPSSHSNEINYVNGSADHALPTNEKVSNNSVEWPTSSGKPKDKYDTLPDDFYSNTNSHDYLDWQPLYTHDIKGNQGTMNEKTPDNSVQWSASASAGGKIKNKFGTLPHDLYTNANSHNYVQWQSSSYSNEMKNRDRIQGLTGNEKPSDNPVGWPASSSTTTATTTTTTSEFNEKCGPLSDQHHLNTNSHNYDDHWKPLHRNEVKENCGTVNQDLPINEKTSDDNSVEWPTSSSKVKVDYSALSVEFSNNSGSDAQLANSVERPTSASNVKDNFGALSGGFSSNAMSNNSAQQALSSHSDEAEHSPDTEGYDMSDEEKTQDNPVDWPVPSSNVKDQCDALSDEGSSNAGSESGDQQASSSYSTEAKNYPETETLDMLTEEKAVRNSTDEGQDQCSSLADDLSVKNPSDIMDVSSEEIEKYRLDLLLKYSALEPVVKTEIKEKTHECLTCGKMFLKKSNLATHTRTHTGEKLFECLTCGKRFTQKSTLQSHNTIHTGEKSYKCDTCGKAFSQKSNLQTHIRTHTGEKPYECVTCGKKFSYQCHLHTHIRTHTGEKPFECAVCGKNFANKSILDRHIKTHTRDRPHECALCGKTFSRKYRLSDHMKTHTGEKSYECGTCGKTFTLKSALYCHIKTHFEEKSFECLLCGKAFSQKFTLDCHIKTHTGEQSYECGICGKAFSMKPHLDCHIRSHTGERPYECVMCEKTFSHKYTLDCHIRTHTGEKPYECVTCGKTFSNNSNLHSHIRSHTGEKPYGCVTCGKAFSHKSTLDRHIRIHTGEKAFECNTCGKAFSQKATLEGHLRIHSGEKSFECGACGKTFTHKGNLDRHMKTHTG